MTTTNTPTPQLAAFRRALAFLTTAELRDLLHDTHGGDPDYVHAIHAELQGRERGTQ